jgi:hypothetical protein
MGKLMKIKYIAILAFSASMAISQTSTNINPLANSTTDPFGTTLNDSFTLSSKTDYSLNKTISVTANTQWLLGCIQNTEVKSNDCKPLSTNPQWESMIEGNASYSDVWKESTDATTRSLQYAIEDETLHNSSSTVKKLIYGTVSSLSDSHDTTQAIKANLRMAYGYFLQHGSIDDSSKSYGLYYVQLSQSYVDTYQPAHNYNSTGITVSSKNRWEKNKTELDLETSMTFPFVSFADHFQSAVDGKLSYWISKSASLTFETEYNYYGVAPTGYNQNAVATSLGITWKPKD